MAKALLLHIIAIPVFAIQLLRAVPAEGWRFAWKRIPFFIVFWLVFTLLNIIHIVGHISDEIFFFAYRKIALKNPVFILGIPRSGTTYLQRLLSKDDTFTTFTTWEALLAPSITEKKLYRLLAYISRPLLVPLEKMILSIRRKLFHNMDTIHKLRLQEPEEDFLILLPVLGCFLPAFICPNSNHYWQLGYFDTRLSPFLRNCLLDFYSLCLKKHMYFAGSQLRFLSKNPSLTSWIDSLLTHFPDAKIIACVRPPEETIPSQLSSLRPAMAMLAGGTLSPKTQNSMIELLYSYYFQLGKFHHHKHLFILPMTELQSTLRATILKLYEYLDIQPSQSFMNTVSEFENQSRHYSSGHQYQLSGFSLTKEIISKRFDDVWPLKIQASGR